MAAPTTTVLALLCGVGSGQAQEAVRASLAGAEAAEARRKAVASIGYYNLMAGNSMWRVTGGLGTQLTDNVNLSPSDEAEGDINFTPSVGVNMFMPVTERNALNFDVNFGYSAYVKNTDLNQFYINPGTGLSFDVFVGDWLINFHDRFSISTQAYQNPTVSGSGDYRSLQNDLGVTGLWDLNKVQVTLGYDYTYLNQTSGNAPQTVGSGNVFFATAGYAFQPTTTFGVQLGGGLNSYTQNPTLDTSSQFNAGFFANAQITDYLSLRGDMGYLLYWPNYIVPVSDPNVSGVYFDLSLVNRLTKHITQSLIGGRNLNTGLSGSAIAEIFVRWDVAWAIFRKLTINTSFYFTHGEYQPQPGETYDYFGWSIGFGRPITKKLSGSFTYQGVIKNDSIPSLDYNLNTLSLRFNYNF